MEDNSKKKNVDGVSGVSASVGSAIGMVAGSFLDSELHAAENNTNPTNIVTQETVSEPEPEVTDETPVTVITVEPEQTTQQDNDTEIEVVAYETVTDGYGNEMDVALLSVDDQEVLLLDADMDGLADVMVSDLNGDNVIQDDEVLEVTGYDISMDEFEDEFLNDNANESLAYNDDYVNNADVTDFMA